MNKTRSIEETIGLLDRLTEAYKKLHRIWDGVETRLERKHQIRQTHYRNLAYARTLTDFGNEQFIAFLH